MSVWCLLSRRKLDRVVDIVVQRLVSVGKGVSIRILKEVSYLGEFAIAIVELTAVDFLGKSHVSEILDVE